MDNLFEKATRQKLSFLVTGSGNIQVQDLWDLSIERLASLGKLIKSQLENEEEDDSDFGISKPNKTKEKLELQLAIVKHIFDTKTAEKVAADNAKADKAHNDKIKELIAQKKEGKLQEMSVEELEKLLK